MFKFKIIFILTFCFSISSKAQCSFNFDLGNDTSICLGENIQLIGPSAISYSWTPINSVSNPTTQSPTFNPLITTKYYLSAVDNLGCIGEDSITITVNSFNGILTLSQDDSICSGESTQLTATGGISYLWSPSNSLNSPTTPFPTASPTNSTVYTVTATDNQNCQITDSVSIIVFDVPNFDAGNDTTVCPGSSIHLNASGGISYQWINPININNFMIHNPIASPDDSITYYVNITDSNNCINIDSVSVKIYEEPEADAGFNDYICDGDPYQLNASGGVSYQWEPFNLVNHPTIANPLSFPDDDTEFTVQVTDSNGCIDMDTVRILVFKIFTDEDTLLCKGDSTQVNLYGDPAVSFEWSPTAGVSDALTFNPWITAIHSRNYVVTASDSKGCIDTDTIRIEVPDLTPIIDTNTIPGCDGLYVEYENLTPLPIEHLWVFNDGTTSNDLAVEKLIDYESTNLTTIYTNDENGCRDSLDINVTTLDFDHYFSWYLPNVFTPNNDQINDLFEIQLAGRMNECANLFIFNKWGEVQFQSSGNNVIWDGFTSVGTEAQPGTYYFTISVKHHQKNGSIQLFR